jgi:hypothetical protein
MLLLLKFYDEQIDPRHRYGHNLHYYYDCWLHCESKQPFFYWLVVQCSFACCSVTFHYYFLPLNMPIKLWS